MILYAEEGEIKKIDLFSRRADYLGTLDAPKNLKSIRYAGSGTIFVEFNTEDPDRWEGSLYRIVNR